MDRIRAASAGVLQWQEERVFSTALAFRDFDDFVEKMVKVTHSDLQLGEGVINEVRQCFERRMTPRGARFVRDMRVNLLRRP